MADDYMTCVRETYAAAALEPDPSLCCIAGTHWSLPDLHVPAAMQEMNYGCGTTVHPGDLIGHRPILYVGVGGGLEALQFAYVRRLSGGVIAVDPVPEMRAAAERNLLAAARLNPWFDPAFVRIVDGAAESLPVADASVEVVAQNCLFNVFSAGDLARAVREVHRVLVPGGRFSSSDPVSSLPVPDSLKRSHTLRARCCAGCQTYDEYLATLAAGGFSRLVVRSRIPYRLLLPREHPEIERAILLESLEVLALKTAAHDGVAEIHSGRHAIYRGPGSFCLDGRFTFAAGTPVSISDATAQRLAVRPDFLVTEPTYHARGPGCC
ncbi:MAG: methyltransferase domain-containing protein [Planctomycetota bacterium]